mmetsp:Transcript_4887/g.12111  ORF Transcript_4887/g.12111 Transcript_4887/m.12111 type:complete len:615 (-) Transcript_4887:965-2809(-)|eukprot:CAMPEP_0178991860 /NCGR_PEP_ID=MMETSP0795-20121207/5776_1 /TAXON_ID=88552 /ORGANISM="Amoebophrya sp., Strain Ameob2" /LENGTH=614 /DNA_ID=CAMNT_0020683643 /DNA_START=186 /DNA_END=2030 /DNA_ORIENTATION=+
MPGGPELEDTPQSLFPRGLLNINIAALDQIKVNNVHQLQEFARNRYRTGYVHAGCAAIIPSATMNVSGSATKNYIMIAPGSSATGAFSSTAESSKTTLTEATLQRVPDNRELRLKAREEFFGKAREIGTSVDVVDHEAIQMHQGPSPLGEVNDEAWALSPDHVIQDVEQLETNHRAKNNREARVFWQEARKRGIAEECAEAIESNRIVYREILSASRVRGEPALVSFHLSPLEQQQIDAGENSAAVDGDEGNVAVGNALEPAAGSSASPTVVLFVRRANEEDICAVNENEIAQEESPADRKSRQEDLASSIRRRVIGAASPSCLEQEERQQPQPTATQSRFMVPVLNVAPLLLPKTGFVFHAATPAPVATPRIGFALGTCRNNNTSTSFAVGGGGDEALGHDLQQTAAVAGALHQGPAMSGRLAALLHGSRGLHLGPPIRPRLQLLQERSNLNLAHPLSRTVEEVVTCEKPEDQEQIGSAKVKEQNSVARCISAVDPLPRELAATVEVLPMSSTTSSFIQPKPAADPKPDVSSRNVDVLQPPPAPAFKFLSNLPKTNLNANSRNNMMNTTPLAALTPMPLQMGFKIPTLQQPPSTQQQEARLACFSPVKRWYVN